MPEARLMSLGTEKELDMVNLFDITREINGLQKGPRQANDAEVTAYMQWQREKRGLPDFEQVELHFNECRNGRRYERGACKGATFGQRIEQARTISYGRWEDEEYIPPVYQAEVWENGAFSIVMPGHDMHRQRVTLETLDDAGEVLNASTMPIEPKKGGVIWSREDVRAAAGPVAKAKKGRGKAAESVSAPTPAFHTPTAYIEPEPKPEPEIEVVAANAEADQEAPALEIAVCEPETGPESKPDQEMAADPFAALLARIEALEARLDALPVESGEATEIVAPPSGEIQPKRTAAHERAVRRAWAERRARRSIAVHLRIGQAQYDNAVESRNRWKSEAEAALERERAALAKRTRAVKLAKRHWKMRLVARGQYQAAEREADRERAKRQRSTTLARYRGQQMGHMAGIIREVNQQGEFERQRANVLAAQLAKLQADMVDPTCPERPSDLLRLKEERDQARTALAAVEARAQRQQTMLDQCAEHIEKLAGRVASAEASLRARAG